MIINRFFTGTSLFATHQDVRTFRVTTESLLRFGGRRALAKPAKQSRTYPIDDEAVEIALRRNLPSRRLTQPICYSVAPQAIDRRAASMLLDALLNDPNTLKADTVKRLCRRKGVVYNATSQVPHD